MRKPSGRTLTPDQRQELADAVFDALRNAGKPIGAVAIGEAVSAVVGREINYRVIVRIMEPYIMAGNIAARKLRRGALPSKAPKFYTIGSGQPPPDDAAIADDEAREAVLVPLIEHWIAHYRALRAQEATR